MPARVMSANHGLREISHSITGGSIGAQGRFDLNHMQGVFLTWTGYWVPYEAAKAVAATFCWEIRYALTPVFGVDFPDLCIDPSNSAFMRLEIDPVIVKHCEEAAHMSHLQSQEASIARRSQAPTRSKNEPHWTPKSQKPRMTDIESGYGTDSERSAFGSPVSSNSNLWTPVNIPRSTNWAQYQFPSPIKTPLSTSQSTSRISSCTGKKKSLRKREAVEDQYPSDASSVNVLVAPKRRKISVKLDAKQLTQEALAAKTLMELHRADMSLRQRVRAMSRRATA